MRTIETDIKQSSVYNKENKESNLAMILSNSDASLAIMWELPPGMVHTLLTFFSESFMSFTSVVET